MKQNTSLGKILLILIITFGWFALIGQFYLSAVNRVTSFPEMMLRYFTFFTILTNILVALCSTFILFNPDSRWGSFFSKQTTLTAIAVNILVVGIVYNLILRSLWNPHGMQRIVDELLHLIVPALFVSYWFIFTRKNELEWKNIFWWLLYPLLYFVVIIIRGAFTGYYPYPFIDVTKHGYNSVLINSGIITLAFIIISLLFVGIGKMGKRNTV